MIDKEVALTAWLGEASSQQAVWHGATISYGFADRDCSYHPDFLMPIDGTSKEVFRR